MVTSSDPGAVAERQATEPAVSTPASPSPAIARRRYLRGFGAESRSAPETRHLAGDRFRDLRDPDWRLP
jgi:hypothetical protein